MTKLRYEVGTSMEQGAKKLVAELEVISRRMRADERRANAIRTALEIMGVRPQETSPIDFYEFTEAQYSDQKPFRSLTIGQAALAVLAEFSNGLDKNQVEYMLTIGGYPFEAKDPTSSVEITLRRLATEGKCTVEKRSGPHGSIYKTIGYKEKKEDAVEDSGATTTAQKEKASE